MSPETMIAVELCRFAQKAAVRIVKTETSALSGTREERKKNL